MRDRDKDIYVNTEHRTLRIVAFVIALAVAVTAFTIGVLQIGHKEEGYQTITAEADEDAPLYAQSVTFRYYFAGRSSEIKEQLKSLTSQYSMLMKRYYKSLDASAEYPGYINIATLNRSMNAGDSKNLAVGSELYGILKEAYAYTCRGEGYNMFAGALYAYWNSILSLAEPEDFDPALEPEAAGRLERLTKATSDLSNFRIVFADDVKYEVRVEVSKDYLELLSELEIPETLEDGGFTILDLNLLHDAFLVSRVAEGLEQQFPDGYIETDSGLMRSLAGHERGEYCKYDFLLAEPETIGTIPVSGRLAVSLFRNVPIGESEFGRYSVMADGIATYRSPYVNALTGQSSELLAASYAVDADGDIVGAAYCNVVISGADSAENITELHAELASSGMTAEITPVLH